MDRAPALDGTLKDPAWEKLPWIDMPEVSLGKLEAKTRFKMGYDSQNLYFGFECEEPLIDEMKVLNYQHDGDVFASESIELFFDPETSGTKFMHIIVGPAPENRYDSRLGYIDDPLNSSRTRKTRAGTPSISMPSISTRRTRMDHRGRHPVRLAGRKNAG